MTCQRPRIPLRVLSFSLPLIVLTILSDELEYYSIIRDAMLMHKQVIIVRNASAMNGARTKSLESFIDGKRASVDVMDPISPRKEHRQFIDIWLFESWKHPTMQDFVKTMLQLAFLLHDSIGLIDIFFL